MIRKLSITNCYLHHEFHQGLLNIELMHHSKRYETIQLHNQLQTGNFMQGAIVIQNSIPSFPAGTVHFIDVESPLVKVKELIIVKYKHQYLITRDNGFVFLLSKQFGKISKFQFDNETFIIQGLSTILEKNLDEYEELQDYSNVKKQNWPQIELSDNEVIATIIYIDQAGNLYLNIQENQLSELNIDLNNCRMETIRNHYLPIRYKTSKLGRTIHSDVKATTSPVGFVILYMEFSNTAEILGLTPLDRIKFLK